MSKKAKDDLTEFPRASSDDPDDVRWALETGKAMWQKGDHREALRWLRRAAETASEEGADKRALELAKAAADRRTSLELPPSIAPPAAEESGKGRPSARPSAPQRSARSAAAQSSARPSSAEPSAPARAASAPPPAGEPAATQTQTEQMAVPDEPPAATAEDLPEEPTQEWRSDELLDQRISSLEPKPRGSAESGAWFAGHQAMRVALTELDHRGVFKGRPLKPGERPPGGTQVALLVALEPEAELFPKPK